MASARLWRPRPHTFRRPAVPFTWAQPLANRNVVARMVHSQHTVLETLEERGLIHQIAGNRASLGRILQTGKIAIYSGIDPTAPSLHLGHLLPLMVLFWLYHYGHHTISLVGGGTARVGDPSGRLTSREQKTSSVHAENRDAMCKQVEELWENAAAYGIRHGFPAERRGTRELLDNSTWLQNLNILEFLSTLGSGMRIGTMLGKDTVRNKMEMGDGMSFAEFTYPLLQGWDWWHMYKESNVLVQVGGGDQYGNIIAGMDAVRYAAQREAQAGARAPWLNDSGKIREENLPSGITVPLLTTASGAKFGKSAGNAIWLNPELTSAFDLYGFLLSTADADVERYLKLFTFVPLAQITTVLLDHKARPDLRKAQHLLASEVLELVYGTAVAQQTRASHQVSRSPTLHALTSAQPLPGRENSSPQGVVRSVLPPSAVIDVPLSRVLYNAGIAATKSEGTRMVAQGSIYIAVQKNKVDKVQPMDDLQFMQANETDAKNVTKYITNGMLVLRIGKWKIRVVEIADDSTAAARPVSEPGDSPSNRS